MSKNRYIAMRPITAEVENNEKGEPGYRIYNEKGEPGPWIGKDSFDKWHLRLHLSNGVDIKDIDALVAKWVFKRLDKKTIIGIAILKTGFRVYATASSIDTSPTDGSPGVELCKERLKQKIMNYLGFIGQWAFHGLKLNPDETPIYLDLTDLENMDI